MDTSDLEQVRAALRPNTKLIYVETPANPILRIADIAALAEIAHAAGALLAVDSTWAGPVLQRPLALGADYVIHSLTKYLNGHGDALGGAVLGPAEGIQRIRQEMLVHLGGALSPFNAWLILRGAGDPAAAHASSTARTPWRWRASWKRTPRSSASSTPAWPATRTTRWPPGR